MLPVAVQFQEEYLYSLLSMFLEMFSETTAPPSPSPTNLILYPKYIG